MEEAAEVGTTTTGLEVAELGATTTDEELTEVGATEEVLAEVLATGEADALPEASGAGMLESSALLHPVLLVNSAGQLTCLKLTVGLSAPSNQSNLKLQPGLRASGKAAQEETAATPPYCAPHPEEGAPNSFVQPLKIPTPPPGIAKSNWFEPRSPPVLLHSK